MSFSLNTTIIEPEENGKIENILVLLHGYGGDGKDISSLALNMRRHIKKTVFLYSIKLLIKLKFTWHKA